MSRMRLVVVLCATLGFSVLIASPASALGRGRALITPLPRSEYAVRPVCAPGGGGLGDTARCMALQLVARTPQARARTRPLGAVRVAGAATPCEPPTAGEGCLGLTPHDLHSAYELPTEAEGDSPPTVAVVDAYNDPNAAEDLAAYSKELKLPECTETSGCFTQVNEQGETANLPAPHTEKELEHDRSAAGWNIEISLDIETVHAVCENCHILLVEADGASTASLETAEDTAAERAGIVSNSWGEPECAGFECQNSAAFDHPRKVIAAAAGDEGYLGWLEEGGPSSTNYPAASPHVLAVGGTRLNPLGPAGEWSGESVWNDGGTGIEESEKGDGATGGGCSFQFTAAPWQQDSAGWREVGCGTKRGVSDVSADADPYSGLEVYDSGPGCGEGLPAHWCTIGGTSLATPLTAAVFALAGGAGDVEFPAETLYEAEAGPPRGSLHDVTEGSNGVCPRPFDEETGESACSASEEAALSCSSDAICLARVGYDGPTGVGTPDGLAAFIPPAGLPLASTEGPSSLASETVVLEGSVEPMGHPLEGCFFEYWSGGAHSRVACAAIPGELRGRWGVSASVGGLQPGTLYHFELVVRSAVGEGTAQPATFETRPAVGAGPATGALPSPPAPAPAAPVAVTGSVVAAKSPPVEPDARLASTSLSVTRSGTVNVRISCPRAAVSCTGTVSLRSLKEIALGAGSAGRRRAVIVTLASETYKLAGSTTATVRLRLSREGRKLLARSRRLRVRAVVFARDPAGASDTTQAIVTLRRP